jgi:hypothetical protein
MGEKGKEYIFFATQSPVKAYCYEVVTHGQPNMHPDNPKATGPVAKRDFIKVSEYNLASIASTSPHTDSFHVDDRGIFYGIAWGGVYQWKHDWTPVGWVFKATKPSSTQTSGYHIASDTWWAGGSSDRKIYRFNGTSWVHIFTHPNLGGSHHDGLEIIGDVLFVSDMTSDVIWAYRLDKDGNLIDKTPTEPYAKMTYSNAGYVEGMGRGPNNHLWVGGYSYGNLFELGGGDLQIAIEGVPDQTIPVGQDFEPFDLDDYILGEGPFTWEWTGNEFLTIEKDTQNIVTINSPPGWKGSETVTFTATHSSGEKVSDDATYTVCCPCPGDDDCDAIADIQDNCPKVPNRNQSDQDLDGVGDACDCAPKDPNQPNPETGTCDEFCSSSVSGSLVDGKEMRGLASSVMGLLALILGTLVAIRVRKK